MYFVSLRPPLIFVWGSLDLILYAFLLFGTGLLTTRLLV